MFWIGMLVGGIIATIAIVGFIAICCRKVYDTWDTFESMVEVVSAASDNRESVVVAYHDGEALTHATFEEL